MMPRPKARGKTPVEVVDVNDLAREVLQVSRANRAPPAAILAGTREWVHMRRQRDFMRYAGYWPGGEETFAGVPVVINREHGTPRVMATQQDLEDALLGGA